MIQGAFSNYALLVLSVLGLVQLGLIGLLLRRQREGEPSRVEQRLAHFAEALALLTDTTQTGFASVANELSRVDTRRSPAVNRAAAAKRIVGAARRGRSVQDIAATEDVSESEIRLHLGLAPERSEGAASFMVPPRVVSVRRPRGTLNIGA